jgi:hypothetical protein
MNFYLHNLLLVVSTLVMLVTITALPGFAQTKAAAISGQVVDETGGALPGATVTVRDAASGRERVTQTDAAGRFSLAGLRSPGPYILTVELSGFSPLIREAVDANGPLTLVMRVSSVTDSIVVRGTARNVASSVAGKRAADGVVDMVSTDEIGRLPDKNIGETLNRIPGVSMLLEKGEGRFIQIRGLSPRLNNVTLNGMAVGNMETEQGGRLLPLDVVGSELLSSVQVLKTPTPDMDGQGVGGTLNLSTKQPFDFASRLTTLFSMRAGGETIEAVAPADTKELPYTMDATLAGRSAGDKVGWLVGVSYSNRYTPLLGLYNDNWRTLSLGGQSVTYPTNVKNNVTVTGRERLNPGARSAGRAVPDVPPRALLRAAHRRGRVDRRRQPPARSRPGRVDARVLQVRRQVHPDRSGDRRLATVLQHRHAELEPVAGPRGASRRIPEPRAAADGAEPVARHRRPERVLRGQQGRPALLRLR